MSDFIFFCPECAQKIVCDQGYAGRSLACPICGKSVVAPIPKPTPPTGEKQASPSSVAAEAGSSGKLQRALAIGYPCLAFAGLVAAVWFGVGFVPKLLIVWAILAFVPMFFLCLGVTRLAAIGLKISCAGLGLLLLCLGTITLAKLYYAPKIVIRESQGDLDALQPRIVDEVIIGARQSEQEHNLGGEHMLAGPFNGKYWRSAITGGSIDYVMKVLPDQPMSLNCRYWGSEQAGRTFDISIDDKVIATQNLEFNVPGHFFDAEYKIPRGLTRGKDEVTVKFQAHPGLAASGLFGCQILKR
ncbi:MAG TPA: DUF6805 domain-containing protein [Candidatus Angelobacter sp.]|nr:DUF6805 domain-containing protein [Candidatus Angelobacter sp.]